MTDQPKELPDNLPPLPDAPKGMRWEYRGMGFTKMLPKLPLTIAFTYGHSGWLTGEEARGIDTLHYAEAVPINPPVDWQARAESLEAENSNLKMLLARYVEHVRDYEGVDFLDTMPDHIHHEILEITKQALGESGAG